MSAAPIKVGDLVAIRGDLRRNYHGKCEYLDEQLVDGKYVRHTGHGGIWTGRVEEIRGDMAKVSGAWRGIERYEVVKSETAE
jgi:hypothetical protein